MSTWIQTYTGKRFDPMNPRHEDVDILDIAHALSMQCRFSGHVRFHYSVAQHSVLVSRHCDSKDALWGLLHDASEAYLVDLPTPLKYAPGLSEVYRMTEARLMAVICDCYGLPHEMPESVKNADLLIRSTEARQLFAGPLVEGWKWGDYLPASELSIPNIDPGEARYQFLERLTELRERGRVSQ